MRDQPRVAGNFSWKTNLFQMGLVSKHRTADPVLRPHLTNPLPSPQQVMLSLITQHEPAMPPLPQRIYIPPLNPANVDDDDLIHADYAADEPPSPTGDAPPPLRFDPNPNDDDIEDDGDRLDEALFGPEAYPPQNWNNQNPHDLDDWVREDWIRVWSYGGYVLDESDEAATRGPLMRYDHVDRKLRRLVAQCLCADPYYRPRMRWLDGVVGGEIGRRWGGGCGGDGDGDWDGGGGSGAESKEVEEDTDEGVREWVRELFERPLPVDDTHVSWSQN